jgi:hypothetical protein
MYDSQGDRRILEDYLASLTRRINELEQRVAELEGEAASKAAPAASRQQAPQRAAQQQAAQQQAAQWAAQQQAARWAAQQQAAQQQAAQWAAQQQAAQWAAQQQAAQRAAGIQAAAEAAARQKAQREQQRAAHQTGAPKAEPGAAPSGGTGMPPGMGFSLTSIRDLESRMTGRLMAWVGGAAVLLGVVFFLSLAFSRGWIGPEGRVGLGVAGGGLLMAAGAWLLDRKQASLGHVVVAVGLGIVSLSLFAGTRLYDLYPPEWALAGSFLAALGAAAIAIRADSEALAIFGLLAIAAAPPVMGAPANLVTVGFLAITVTGTTLIALGKSWRWLPPAAFAITAPQLVYWLIARPEPGMGIPAIAAFWVLNAVAASADELRADIAARGPATKADETAKAEETARAEEPAKARAKGAARARADIAARAEAAAKAEAEKATAEAAAPAQRESEIEDLVGARAESLFLANSFVAIAGGLWVLSGDLAPWQGAFLAGAAIAHFIVGGLFIRWRGETYPFGLLANAIGVVVVALAIERQWDGILVPIGWSVEAVVLAFVYGRRRNDYAGVAAAILGGLQILHLVIFEYPWLSFTVQGNQTASLLPFANEPGVALAGVLIAAVVAGWATQRAVVQLVLTAVGALFFAYTLPFQLSGPALVAAWAIEGAGLLGFWRTRRFDYLAAVVIPIAGLAVLHLVAFEFPIGNWTLEGTWGPGPFPFIDQSALALGAVLASAVAGGWLSRSAIVRYALLFGGSLLLAYALPFELQGPALVAAWAFEAAFVVAFWRSPSLEYLAWAALGMGALAVMHLVALEYPIDKWTLKGTWGPGQVPFADQSALALACLLAAAVTGGWLSRRAGLRYGLLLAGSLVVAYALPFELTGPALVAGWSAQAVALVAIWGWRHRPEVAAGAFVSALLALAYFAVYAMPAAEWRLEGGVAPASPPFVDDAGLTLAILLGAAALCGLLSRSHGVRCALTTGGFLLVAYSLPFELSGVALAGGWAALMPASVAADRLLDRLPGVPANRSTLARVPVWEMNEPHWPDAPVVATAVAALLAVAHLFTLDLPIGTFGEVVVPATPFVDEASLAAALVTASFLLTAVLTLRPDVRVAGIVGASAVVAFAAYFELALPYAAVAWSALAMAILYRAVVADYGRPTYVLALATLLLAGLVGILGSIDPPERLGVLAAVPRTGMWFEIDAAVSCVAVAMAGLAVARFLPMRREWRAGLVLGSGVLLVYLASTVVVDLFQRQLGGPIALEELQKQAQVGVSITWALIGMAVFLVGVARWRAGVREAGLALLGLATGKVFVFDLSYLDVAYRVLSLVGLGLLLLAGAYLYQSLRPKKPEEAKE